MVQIPRGSLHVEREGKPSTVDSCRQQNQSNRYKRPIPILMELSIYPFLASSLNTTLQLCQVYLLQTKLLHMFRVHVMITLKFLSFLAVGDQVKAKNPDFQLRR